MQGPRRKIIHATLYELLAIVIVTMAIQGFSDVDAQRAGGLALSTSAMALAWNMAFNTLFERWEMRQASRHRTLRRRIAHAIGFEGGLVLMTVPLIAWWLQVGWWAALVTDLGFVAFFLCYTFAFNWLFDKMFGLPASATMKH